MMNMVITLSFLFKYRIDGFRKTIEDCLLKNTKYLDKTFWIENPKIYDKDLDFNFQEVDFSRRLGDIYKSTDSVFFTQV